MSSISSSSSSSSSSSLLLLFCAVVHFIGPTNAFWTTIPLPRRPAVTGTTTTSPTTSTAVTTAFVSRSRTVTLLAARPKKTSDDDDDDDGLDDDDDDVDVPEDWSEEDILAGFDAEGIPVEDIVVADDDDDDVDDEDVEDEDDDNDDDDKVAVLVDDDGVDINVKTVVKSANDDDDDDDDDEIDETVFEEDDEDEEEDDIVEEVVGDVGEWEEEDEDEGYETIDTGAATIDWDEDEDGANYELQDDPDDPDYMIQKKMVDQAIAASQQRAADESFDPLDYVMNQITPQQEQEIQNLPFMKELEERTRDMILSVEDVEDLDLPEEVKNVPDLVLDDPYPRYEQGEDKSLLEETMGLTDDDMEQLDESIQGIQENLAAKPWDKVMLRAEEGFEGLSNKTLEEMEACLDEIGGSAYNSTRWLLYDLDFNVSNLILAAVKHNKEAPILFQHWYPQLLTYSRYKHAQDRDFDFTWEDVEKADIGELERYYKGFGYDEIPNKAPAETGIISLEDLDEEEIKMAAFENWMTEVYNPEWDRKDFDDDGFQDEDNVFSNFYEAPQHPDLPAFEDAADDIEQWKEDMGDDPAVQEYRDKLGQSFEYEVEEDEEFQKEFRGHLIIACTGMDQDLDTAEKITLRFEKEFGKKVFVETRVLALAREEDNVLEIWLESYEIELLHSKKRATSNAKGWTGPAEVDDAQVDFLVDRVRFLISDDSRYSYQLEFEEAE